jgi:hypothetical protein
METAVILIDDYDSITDESGLRYFASDAAQEMGFSGPEELQEAVLRAGNLCLAQGLPLKQNFKRIYRCTENGVYCDWKLSVLAYRLVCLNGYTLNPRVAALQVKLLSAWMRMNN